MANGHGGRRRPRRPAAYSGPGKHSQRTDGSPDYQMQKMIHSITTGDGRKIEVYKPGSSEYTDEYQQHIKDTYHKRVKAAGIGDGMLDPGYDLNANVEYIGPGSEYDTNDRARWTHINFDGSRFTPFGAPSQYPDQPETAGSPFGPGKMYVDRYWEFDDEETIDVNWIPPEERGARGRANS